MPAGTIEFEIPYVYYAGGRNFSTVSDLLAYTGDLPEGEDIGAAGFRYTVAPRDAVNYHLITAGGVKLYVQRSSEGFSFRAFGALETNLDNEAEINLAIACAKADDFGIISDSGTFATSGGHVLDGVQVTGLGATGLIFNHVDRASIASTYSQTLTVVTITAANHGLQVGESVYLNFNSGAAADGCYTVATVPTSGTFTVLAATATTSGNVTVYPGTCCFKAFVADPNDSVMGTGLSNAKIVNQTTNGHGIGHLASNYAHTRVDNVEVADYELDTEFAFVWENYNNKWTESGIYTRMRATNCYNHFTMRQNFGAAGTLSMGYNRFEGTASSSLESSKNVTIDGVSVYDNPVFNFNLYMGDGADARGLRILNGGRLNGSSVQVVGEKPGGGLHTALEIDATSQMRDSTGYIKFENGLISISSSATVVNDNMPITSSGEGIFLRYDTRPGVSARLSANFALASATWQKPTVWTEDMERPSGANNTSGGTFTAPVTGLYLFGCAACFTPVVSDRIAVRIATTARNFVVAQNVATTTDDVVLGGEHIVALTVGDTCEMQLYTSNVGGDTIRASDADGSKTMFSVAYIAS